MERSTTLARACGQPCLSRCVRRHKAERLAYVTRAIHRLERADSAAYTSGLLKPWLREQYQLERELKER